MNQILRLPVLKYTQKKLINKQVKNKTKTKKQNKKNPPSSLPKTKRGQP